jgi:cytoskeletal protein CcmA (bactofilin family)
MFALKRRGTVIAEGLKIIGSVTAEGLVEVNGQIEGDMHCTSLVVSPQAFITGGIQAEHVVVNGKVEGPIHGGEVILKSRAHVVGDIQHKSLAIEKGAFFDGRSLQTTGSTNGHQPEVGMRPPRQMRNGREAVSA